MSLNRFKLVQIGLNQDQVGHGLNLWSCLYGICMEKKYRFKMSLPNISSFKHPELFQAGLATPFLLMSTQQWGDSLFVPGKKHKRYAIAKKYALVKKYAIA